MTPTRYQQLHAAIAALEAEGISPSAHHLHQRLGGSYPRLLQDLRQFRTLGPPVPTAAEQAIRGEDIAFDSNISSGGDEPDTETVPPVAPHWTARPPACPRCGTPTVWLLRGDLLTCVSCSTSIQRVDDAEP